MINLKVIRIGRVPRLLRLFRILRMIKVLRIFSKLDFFKEYISELSLSVGAIRMIKVLILQFFMVHLMACLWYLFATFEQNIFQTWVGERNVVDQSQFYKYMESWYWALQTVTTVGYGDVPIQTTSEYILALAWMVIGVNFYSFIIGNVSSIISAMDLKTALLN